MPATYKIVETIKTTNDPEQEALALSAIIAVDYGYNSEVEVVVPGGSALVIVEDGKAIRLVAAGR